MARKQNKANPPASKDAPAKDGTPHLTYVGPNPVVGVCGYTLPRNVAVEVSEATAKRFAAHPDFEVG